VLEEQAVYIFSAEVNQAENFQFLNVAHLLWKRRQ
jgi:hypothetical protein